MMDWRAIAGRRGAPRFLLVGPAGAGKTTLVEAAMRSLSPTTAGRAPAAPGDIAWSHVGRGVIIDVPGAVMFPPDARDLDAWERLLRHLRRLRPRRPVDGVIVAVPASLLLDPAQEEERLHVAAAMRERFALAQSLLGFTLPVYVVITKADEIRGFDTFTATLTDGQLRNMLGWSNPHGTDQPFSGAWVAEGIDALHDAVVRTQVERFASSTRLDDSADLFLFSGTLRRMATPLAAMLDEVFRPSLYHDAFSCRGFYLCGRPAAGSTSPAFLDDLLADKVFAERGLGTPLPHVAEARNRAALVAQILCAVLVVGMGLGLYWGDRRLRRGRAEFVTLLNQSDAILVERSQAAANHRALPVRYRLDQSRRLLEDRLGPINDDRLSWVVYRLNPPLGGTLSRIFRDIVLEDFRVALEDKGRRWLRAAQGPPDDPAPSGPDFQDRARYRRLARFAQDYSPFVANYRRYDQLRRVDGTGDIASLGRLSEYLDGTPLRLQALGRPYASALRHANAAAIDCGIFEDRASHESLVAVQARALLDEFRAWSFGEKNPVRSAALDFTDDWALVSTGRGARQDLDRLIADTTRLSTAVTAWTTLETAVTEQPITLFEHAPFTPPPPDAALCPGLLWPDLDDKLQAVERLKGALSAQLLAMEVEPFGSLLEDKDPGLALSDGVAALKKDLDTLQAQSFWSPAPKGADDAPRFLPRLATWRTEDIDDALKTADAFGAYRGVAFNTLEDSSRSALLDLVATEVAELVATRLERTATAGSTLSADTPAMLEELKVMGGVIGKLGRLAPFLSRSPSGTIVLAALDTQAATALDAVDRAASRDYPWVFAWPRRASTLDGLFGRWQDIRRTATAADAPKLWQAVADDQRDAVPKFSALASPFAEYLVARRRLSEPALRWVRIGRDVASFGQKVPGNALGAFDGLMRQGVPEMVPANNCLAGSTATARASGEYFAALRDELAREGERQCHIQIQRDYAAVARVFDAQLKDKFPFVDTPSSSFAGRVREAQGRTEATPEGVKALLDTYRVVDGPAMTTFLEANRACSTDPAVLFLRRVDSASKLLASAADPLLKKPAIVLDLKPEFRLGSNPGTGGDQVAEWRMAVGSRSVREPVAAAAEPLPWTSGDRVSVIARFARDSPSVPTAAGLPPGGSVTDDRTVHFDFTGNWAIFKLLLARGIPSPASAMRLRDVAPTVLAFEIPMQPDARQPPLAEAGQSSPFDVYIRLGIFPRGKTDPLTVDALPTLAPPTVACLGS